MDLDALNASHIRLFIVDELRHLVADVGVGPLSLLPKQVCYRYTTSAMYLRHPADT